MPARCDNSFNDIGPLACSSARIRRKPTSIDWILRCGLARAACFELSARVGFDRAVRDVGPRGDTLVGLSMVAITEIISGNISLCAEFLRRPRRNDPAVLHDVNIVRDLEREADILLDKQDGKA